MSEYKICKQCKGKGYTFESNLIDEGILGIFYDITEGLNKVRCKVCCGTGIFTAKD